MRGVEYVFCDWGTVLTGDMKVVLNLRFKFVKLNVR